MHSLRDGTFWQNAGAPEATGETYDLVVVGGGISGLAAAFLYRQQTGGKARVLILENHDDFGGHAKRNEFTAANGKQLIGYGGSQSLQTPSYLHAGGEEAAAGYRHRHREVPQATTTRTGPRSAASATACSSARSCSAPTSW